MERLDLVDKDGELLGVTYVRDSRPLLEHEFIQDIKIWIKDTVSGKFLFQKHVPRKGSLYGLTGGCVVSGESPLDAVLRETKEEIGLELLRDEVVCLGNFVHRETFFTTVYFYEKDFSKTKFVPDPREVESVHWFTLGEAMELDKKGLMRPSTYETYTRFILATND
ncbi:MAG: NUDIX hydrolase [Firmicutes bacterium]|nr:NUDIX hydrolase [Bacillota bacterium]